MKTKTTTPARNWSTVKLNRVQKLLTAEQARKLPALYAQESAGDAAVVYAKFFTPDSDFTWYATEFDPAEGMFFGLVTTHYEPFGELGYFHATELIAARGLLGLSIERDLHFKPTTLGEIRATARRRELAAG